MNKDESQKNNMKLSLAEQARKTNQLFVRAGNQVKKKNRKGAKLSHKEEADKVVKQMAELLNQVKEKISAEDIGQLIKMGLTGTKKHRDLATRLLVLFPMGLRIRG